VINSPVGKTAAVTGSSSGIGHGSLLDNKPKPETLLENIPLRRLGQPADVASAMAFFGFRRFGLPHGHQDCRRWRAALELSIATAMNYETFLKVFRAPGAEPRWTVTVA